MILKKYFFPELIFSQLEPFLFDAFLCDDVENDAVSSINVSLGCRYKDILHHRDSFLERITLIRDILLIQQTQLYNNKPKF